MREALHNDQMAFSPAAVSFFCEVVKLFIALSLLLMRCNIRGEFKALSCYNATLLLVPSLIYAALNGLRFFIVEAVNPGLLSVMW